MLKINLKLLIFKAHVVFHVRLIQIVSYQVYNNFMYINETRHEDAREQNLS